MARTGATMLWVVVVTVPILVRAGTTGILKRDGTETAFASVETAGEPGNTQNSALIVLVSKLKSEKEKVLLANI